MLQVARSYRNMSHKMVTVHVGAFPAESVHKLARIFLEEPIVSSRAKRIPGWARGGSSQMPDLAVHATAQYRFCPAASSGTHGRRLVGHGSIAMSAIRL